jgi:hypothetical protein
MSGSTFTTNPRALKNLLADCDSGALQLPDFQRGWVWDEDRIIGLIASIARAFPVGTLMTLESNAGVGKKFAHRAIEGVPEAAAAHAPSELLLDGQQRMTSLYQACFSKQPVRTETSKGHRKIKRYYYIDIGRALANPGELESAIEGVPEDRIVREDFGRKEVRNLATPEREYEQLMYPVNQVFNATPWLLGLFQYATSRNRPELSQTFQEFSDRVLQNFAEYQFPVIALGEKTSPEAVCLVFEKVNTGGKVLDAFELLTAMYAAHSFRLRDDWLGQSEHGHDEPGLQRTLATYGRMAGREEGALAKVSATDFLQAVTLLHSKECRLAAEKTHPDNKEKWPAVRATRQTLLALPLDAYKKYREPVLRGFQHAAKVLRQLGIYDVSDLPYQAQLIPLAAILADLGNKAEPAPAQHKIERWFWCGVFGELYGSATESRYARDIMEVPEWIAGGPEPDTVRLGILNPSRLLGLYTRNSAAYKGINALLMREGAKDFRTGQPFDATVFFDENVDIHHVFPQAWCKQRDLPKARWDSIVNKTPLSYRTNRIIGGVAPSAYLAKLEDGTKKDPAIPRPDLDGYLATHCIPIEALRTDDFDAFMQGRQRKLMELVCHATGQPVPAEMAPPMDDEDTDQAIEAQLDAASDDRIHGTATQGAV